MIVTDWIHTIAGFFIIVSLALGVDTSPAFLSKYWLILTALVGINLFQFGITKFCPMIPVLKALGVPESRS